MYLLRIEFLFCSLSLVLRVVVSFGKCLPVKIYIFRCVARMVLFEMVNPNFYRDQRTVHIYRVPRVDREWLKGESTNLI